MIASDFGSYGGGVQSTAMLVLAAERRLTIPTFLFANTGDDSEDPETLAYVRDIAMPYAARMGIELVELQRRRRDGSIETLRNRIDSGSIGIPIRRRLDGPPLSRSCTVDFKVRVVGKELRRRGVVAESPATVAIGISVDEVERSKLGVDPRSPYQLRTYPLLGLGLHRSDCRQVITAAGLPMPPKSACWFCPYHDMEAWRRLKRRRPDLFDAACEMEVQMAAAKGDGRPVFLTRKGAPLGRVVDDQQPLDGLGDDCDSGYCFT